MPFLCDILACRSLAIVGMEKNTGKTECLNYVLRRLAGSGRHLALSSVGVDGERTDQVTGGDKPAVKVCAGTVFATGEKYLRRQGVVTELLEVSDERTALGRVVTARALSDGEVLLAGPSSTGGLARWMEGVGRYGADLTLIDGALSRLSPASPALTEAMILSTGASLSADMQRLVRLTAYAVRKIGFPPVETALAARLEPRESGIWAVNDAGEPCDLKWASTLLAPDAGAIPAGCGTIYVAGALTDGFVEGLRRAKCRVPLRIVVRDFTKVFLSEPVWRRFAADGGCVEVLRNSRLLAVCVNPTAPNGMVLDSDVLCEKLSAAVSLPVYDVVKSGYAV